jgi:DNA polymerase-3 subunit gamma/tau
VDQVPDTYLLQIVELLLQAEPAIKMSSQPKLALEMVFLKMFQTPPALSIDLLVDRLDQLRTAVASGTWIQGAQNNTPAAAPNPIGAAPQDPPSGRPAPPADPQTRPQAAPEEHPGPMVDAKALWEGVQARIAEQRPALAGFLSKANIKTMQNDLLELEVSGNDFVLNNVKKHLPLLETVVADLQGRPMKIKVFCNIQDVVEKKNNKKKSDLLKKQILSHPMVAEALDVFDGKVIDVKVK